MRKFFCFFISVISVFFIFTNDSYANNKNDNKIPKAVIEHAEKNKKYFGKEYSISYIMKWQKGKVYRIKKKTYGIVYSSPCYIVFKGGKILKLTIDERKRLDWDINTHTNQVLNKNNKILTKKLSRNAKKIMEIEDNTPPPEIPNALYKYTNKYMIKGNDVGFLYLMEWNGMHVYRSYWKRYGFIFNPLTVILYDGHLIRRPSQEEFDIMLPLMQDAYEKYLNEQARLHSKD